MNVEISFIRRGLVFTIFALGALMAIEDLAMAQTPSPALLVTTGGPGERALQIIDPLTNKVKGNVFFSGGIPHNIAVSDDGKLAFVTVNGYGKGISPSPLVEGTSTLNYNYISIIDLAAQKELRRLETGLGSIPYDVRFIDGKLYFTAEGYQTVGRFDLGTNQIDWMIGTGQGHQHLLVITKDQKKIFTVNTSSNSVAVIAPWDTPDDYGPPPSKVTVIPVGEAPEGIALSPDEKEVWTTSKRDGRLTIIDVLTKKVKQTVDLKASYPMRLQFTPDGRRVVIHTTFDGDVLVFDATSRKEIKRLKVGKPEKFSLVRDQPVLNGVPMFPKNNIHDLMITPDGTRAYFSLMGNNEVAILDLKTLEWSGKIPTFAVPSSMAWAETK